MMPKKSTSLRGKPRSMFYTNISLVHSLPWNEVNYVYDFGFIPVASHGVFAERE
ncbi:MAG: hypothetical protein Q8O30_00870 [Candidatus Omnitrophota bacterium]|nr:hypothetical protein [Candidatus Omnitrophota bacterium]